MSSPTWLSDPGIRLRDIAAAVRITERAAHRILSEVVEEATWCASEMANGKPLPGQAWRCTLIAGVVAYGRLGPGS